MTITYRNVKGTPLTTAELDANFSSLVEKTGDTGSAKVPVGTTAQRDGAPAAGMFRFNTSLNQFEGHNGAAWGAVGGGATGAAGNPVFVENDAVVSGSYTIGSAAYVAGVTVTIATPGVFTLTNHGFVADQFVHLSTTGALPTGLAVDTPYYVISAGLTADNFRLSATIGGAAINTTGIQSGVHSIGKIKNAMSAGNVSILTPATVTIPTGSTWSLV
jgi:hypothetical protein